MNKVLLMVAVVVFLALYFVSVLYFFPSFYSEKPQDVPSPFFEVHLSKDTVSLGDSFRLDVVSENVGDYGDVHIVSVGFPNKTGGDGFMVASYNFTQAPHFIEVGEDVGSGYSGGTQTISAKYPSIEAVSRPAAAGKVYQMGVVVTPSTLGNFTVYVKSVDIPHVDDSSHYPRSGVKDHQDEFVNEYTVVVVP